METFTYRGPIVGPEMENGITAAFNGTIVKGGKTELFCVSRAMDRHQIPGVVDTTSFFLVNSLTNPLSERRKIPATVLKGIHEHNPEDVRGLNISENEVLFGLTAAERDGRPYPAFSKARYPFGPDDFTAMSVESHLSPGKNVLPLAEDLAVYRKDGDEFNKSLTFLQKENNHWVEGRTISLPTVPWTGENGKYGLTGGARIPMGAEVRFRMVIHGYKIVNGVVEYALGLADFIKRPDGTFDPYGDNSVDPEPLLTYYEATEHMGPGDEPDPLKRVIYSVGNYLDEESSELIAAITLFDRKIGQFAFPLSRLQNEFAYNPYLEQLPLSA